MFNLYPVILRGMIMSY